MVVAVKAEVVHVVKAVKPAKVARQREAVGAKDETAIGVNQPGLPLFALKRGL